MTAASPPARAKIKQVGFRFASGDLAITVSPGRITLTSTAGAWNNLNLEIGQWIFIGGDDTATRYNTGYGYGRVKSFTNNVVVIDNLAWAGGTSGADAGAAKTIEIYTGTFLKDQTSTANQVCRTFQIERQLGSDSDGVQSEIVTGSFGNTLNLNFPLTELHTADLGFVALSDETRTGLQGVKPGTRVPYPSQTPYNTTSSVWRMSLAILDETTVTPTGLFGFASEATMTINNNASVVKGIGQLGGIDIIVGNFDGGGNATGYFRTVAERRAVRNASRLGWDVIKAAGNKGIVYDIPQCRAQGGRVNIAQNDPMTIPFELFTEENVEGYTMSTTFFDYLPNIAMPVV